jgi:glycosyltransferase involved in cell wall biosynthesis
MSASSPLSVGIPTYNHGEYVGATIESLLDQTEMPLELVVCDNFSTDRTAEVLAGFGERIRVIRPPRHLSMMENWNHLVGRLRGEWVALVSSDDLALPGFVEALSRGIRRAPDAVLVRGNVEMIDGAGASLGARKKRPLRRSSPPRNFLERLYGPKVDFNAVAFRKDAWERSGGFPESCRLAGDWAFWLALAPHGSFVTIPEFIAKYRKGHRSAAEELSRTIAWANDYRTLYREIMPRVARELGGVRPGLIRHAMRARCHDFVARLSRTVPPAERGTFSDALAGWARECEVPREIERFRAGARIGKLRFRRLRRWAAAAGLG